MNSDSDSERLAVHRAVEELLQKLAESGGQQPSWLELIDSDANVRTVLQQLKRKGFVDCHDVERIIIEAKDLGGITEAEYEALKDLLKLGGLAFDPVAKLALSRFLYGQDEDGLSQAVAIPKSHVWLSEYLGQYSQYALKNRLGLGLIIICLFLAQAVSIALIEIPRQVLILLSQDEELPWLASFAHDISVRLALPDGVPVLLLVWFFTLTCYTLASWALDSKQRIIGERIANQMQLDAFRSVLHLPLSTLGKSDMGAISSRIMVNPQSANAFFQDAAMKATSDLMVLILMISYLGSLSIPMLGSAAFFTIFMAALAVAVSRRTRVLSSELDLAREKVNTGIREALAAIHEIHSHNTYDFEHSNFKSSVDRFFRVTKSYVVFLSGTSGAMMWLAEASVIVAFGMGAFLVDQGELESATLVAFLLALPRLFIRFTRLVLVIEPFQQHIVPIQNLLDVVNWGSCGAAKPEPESAAELEHREPVLRVTQAAFQHETSGRRVHFGDFELASGQLVALVGDSGAGKSTLLQTLRGTLRPYQGSIELCQTELSTLSRSQLANQIRTMSQDTFLFNRTVSENVAYGIPDAHIVESEIEMSCRRAAIHDVIMRELHGYNAKIRNHGEGLSGGQRRRLALARALMGNWKILLLDEPVKEIPSGVALQIIDELNSLKNGRLIMLSTHNVAILNKCDYVVVFKKEVDGPHSNHGHVIDHGTHEDLIQRCSFYRSLVSTARD